MLSKILPRPSILIRIPASFSFPVNSSDFHYLFHMLGEIYGGEGMKKYLRSNRT
jgi:hypothetical protein